MADRPSRAETQNGKYVTEKRIMKIEIIRSAMNLSYMVREKKQN